MSYYCHRTCAQDHYMLPTLDSLYGRNRFHSGYKIFTSLRCLALHFSHTAVTTLTHGTLIDPWSVPHPTWKCT